MYMALLSENMWILRSYTLKKLSQHGFRKEFATQHCSLLMTEKCLKIFEQERHNRG